MEEQVEDHCQQEAQEKTGDDREDEGKALSLNKQIPRQTAERPRKLRAECEEQSNGNEKQTRKNEEFTDWHDG